MTVCCLLRQIARMAVPEDLKHLIQACSCTGTHDLSGCCLQPLWPGGKLPSRLCARILHRAVIRLLGEMRSISTGVRVAQYAQYFIHNALYWLEEFHFDGLRLDAVHAIRDDSEPDILTELAEAVRQRFGNSRHVHLVLENDDNAAHYLVRGDRGSPTLYNAQWNDDIHHALHVLLTGETDGYYSDYAQRPMWQLGRCLAEGFAFQGDPSPYRDGEFRGEPSRMLPPQCFVDFLQNHDQIGNRAYGERISQLAESDAIRAATGNPFVVAFSPSDVHGRRIWRDDSISILLRLRARACDRGDRGTTERIRALRSLSVAGNSRADSRPECGEYLHPI